MLPAVGTPSLNSPGDQMGTRQLLGVSKFYRRADVQCKDCNKLAPPHYRKQYFGPTVGNKMAVCCRSFHYYVTHKVWAVATDPKTAEDTTGFSVRQLCLYCLRRRLGRPLRVKDFPIDMLTFNGGYYNHYKSNWKSGRPRQMTYIRRMVEYANSDKNTSRVW